MSGVGDVNLSVEGRPLGEKGLVDRAKNGDVSAYTELVRAHQGIALRLAYLVLRDASEAEDATQEAFMKAYRALGRFRPEAEFRPWLLRIVRNEALNRRRSARRRAGLAVKLASDPVLADAALSPEAAVVRDEDRRHLLEAVTALPWRLREVIECRYFLGLSEAETALALGVPAGTVKSRSARAIGLLRMITETSTGG
ncbi:MAG: RNA polymerase sigma factor [Acidimicrobiia bacterium]